MNFPIFINKFIIGNKYLRYSNFWWWWRLFSHQGFRFDDYHIWGSFWSSLNRGWLDMQYKHNFEKIWGKNAQPETIILSQENFDALVEKLNEPPDPKSVERLTEILNKKPPWSEDGVFDEPDYYDEIEWDEKDNIKPMIELGEKWMLENDETLRKLADS